MTDFFGELSFKDFEVFSFYGPESSETTGKMFRSISLPWIYF